MGVKTKEEVFCCRNIALHGARTMQKHGFQQKLPTNEIAYECQRPNLPQRHFSTTYRKGTGENPHNTHHVTTNVTTHSHAIPTESWSSSPGTFNTPYHLTPRHTSPHNFFLLIFSAGMILLLATPAPTDHFHHIFHASTRFFKHQRSRTYLKLSVLLHTVVST